MLVHIKDLIKDAEKKGYAIGAFNVHNLETILGVARAAVKAKSPAIIQVSEGAIKYMGRKPVNHLVSTIAKNLAPDVQIALHLDTGSSFESVLACMDAGFSSVQIDASSMPIDENIELTKKIVDIAHKRDVWVQGEVGSMIGGHGKVGGKITGVPLAEPSEVIAFVKATKVDSIAAAVGTAHGAFTNEDVHLDLVKSITEKLKTPLVLHGGSGVPDKVIAKAIKNGVRIINIGTDIKVAFSDTLKETCKKNRKETDPRILLSPSIDAVEAIVLNKMKLFGSLGRSVDIKAKKL